jgi:hypothetical protein
MPIIDPTNPKSMQQADQGGIDPANLPKLTSAQEAQLLAYNAERSRIMNEDNEAVEVNEYELVAIQKLLQHLQTKYGSRSATFANLSELKKEAEEKFRELGFVAQVDWIKAGMTKSKRQNPPEITLTRRINEWDPELARYATGAGVADAIYEEQKDILKKQGKYTPPPKLKA